MKAVSVVNNTGWYEKAIYIYMNEKQKQKLFGMGFKRSSVVNIH